jgi:hypothetical protein
MGSVVVVGPVRGENLVGLAAEQEVEFLLEDAVELFAELLIEIGLYSEHIELFLAQAIVNPRRTFEVGSDKKSHQNIHWSVPPAETRFFSSTRI